MNAKLSLFSDRQQYFFSSHFCLLVHINPRELVWQIEIRQTSRLRFVRLREQEDWKPLPVDFVASWNFSVFPVNDLLIYWKWRYTNKNICLNLLPARPNNDRFQIAHFWVKVTSDSISLVAQLFPTNINSSASVYVPIYVHISALTSG